MFRLIASVVAHCSQPADIKQTDIVRDHAPVVINGQKGKVGSKVKSVRYVGTADVYNLEVKDHHNFSVNGGLVIHNCPDAMRYVVHSLENLPNAWDVWKQMSESEDEYQ
jgi:hypothetical protein